ncbi:hypothetical protein [Caballeronia sordidicola]|uniref:Uncharacterized protein n=1 Tax=Caballeronia sordidicola TaxID=196367 RepID=A0A242MS23_CABSO|nr:hypothetical protein [Caballeronia sordidicola]OTP70436.1 hypothetical protein PAMC26510_25550 [Caballeronia sordidicola]OTP74146.1 hypothetical protein PAMC26510_17310 [Caballeronia sordidicola]
MNVDPDQWAKMPCSWQKDPDMHRLIAGAPTGTAIAALKLYIALCLKANFAKTKEFPSSGCVKRSITQLCTLTGLSRPVVIAGLRQLQAWRIIECLGGRPAVYHVTDYDKAPYWAKLPSGHLFDGYPGEVVRISQIPNRGVGTLHALQLYLYVASVRDRHSHKAKVTYPRFQSVLGFDRNEIAHAITLVGAYELVTVRTGDPDDVAFHPERPCNVFWLRGSLTKEFRERAAADRRAVDEQNAAISAVAVAAAAADFDSLIERR